MLADLCYVQITEGILQPSVLAGDLFAEHGAPV